MTDLDEAKPEPRKRGKVVAIPKAPKPVNPDCVSLFRGLLEMAEAGDVTEAVVVWLGSDGNTDNERTAISDAVGILGQLKLAADEISAATRED